MSGFPYTLSFTLAGGEPPEIAFDVAAGPISSDQPITVTVDDDGQVVHFTVWVEPAPASALTELAYDVRDDSDYSVGKQYATSEPESVTPVGNGFVVVIERAWGASSGWPWDFTLHAVVVDSDGNVTKLSRSYTRAPAALGPTIAFDPPSGSSFSYDVGAIEVDVSDLDDVARVRIIALGASRAELVYDGPPASVSEPGYGVVQVPILNGRTYQIERVGGWYENFELVVEAEDVDGNVATSSASYTLTSFPPYVDDVPPITTNVTPTPGTPISTMQPLGVDVIDDSGIFRRVLIAVELDGLTELAWDGDAWLGHYAGGGSVRDPIANGFRYTVLRDGGWPSSPTLRVFAFDQGGNEV